jgi:hypothetical protein
VSATGQITSTVASGTVTLESTAPYGTGYKAIRLGNTGSTLTVGVESSAGGSLLTSATGYAGVVSSNSTILQLGASNTIVATLSSGAAAITGTLSTTGNATIGTAGLSPVATPTKLTLDGSYANAGTPTNQQQKLTLVSVSSTEAYGFAVSNDGGLWAQSGNSTGATGYIGFATGGAERGRINSTGLAVTGTLSSTAASNIFTFVNSTAGSATNKISFGVTTNEYSFINYSDTTGYLSIGQPSGRSYGVNIQTNGANVGVFTATGLAVTGTTTSTGAISTAATGASAMVINSGGAATDTALKINRGGGTYWLVAHDSLGGLTFNRDGVDKAYFGRSGVDGLYVTGTLTCTGALSKGSGSFRIEHPLPSKSATHQLVHSFIEGPKCDLIYRGKINLVDGKASVNIDTDSTMTEGTFEVLCANVQCFTSNESGWGAIRGKVVGNILTIEAQDSASTDNVSWMVIGERKDPHIMDTDWTDENGRPIVEPLKPAVAALEAK